jgi:predicted enzyme related to lactoylglutathione lyase
MPLGLWRRRDYGDHRGGTVPRGEIGYLTLHVRDGARAVRLFEGLLGWHFDEARPNGYRHVPNSSPPVGVYGGEDQETRVTWYVRVGDADRLTAEVAGLDGSVVSVSDSPSGRTATCIDDQGMPFYLWQAAPGY